MTVYHVRSMDLHVPGEHCNNYDCIAVVMKHEHDAAMKLLDWLEREHPGTLLQAGIQEYKFLYGTADK